MHEAGPQGVIHQVGVSSVHQVNRLKVSTSAGSEATQKKSQEFPKAIAWGLQIFVVGWV